MYLLTWEYVLLSLLTSALELCSKKANDKSGHFYLAFPALRTIKIILCSLQTTYYQVFHSSIIRWTQAWYVLILPADNQNHIVVTSWIMYLSLARISLSVSQEFCGNFIIFAEWDFKWDIWWGLFVVRYNVLSLSIKFFQVKLMSLLLKSETLFFLISSVKQYEI